MESYFIFVYILYLLTSGYQVKAVDECSSNPCLNGATCVDDGDYGYYTCQCTTNWKGKNCEIAVEGSNCGTNHYSLTGSITSPNYPNNYDNNDHCLYLIRVHGATRIELDFTSFETYDLDFLIIGIGPVVSIASAADWLSGTHTWTYTYITNEIWMEFVSDHRNTSSGWSCTYTADFNGCLCFNGETCIDDHSKQCSCYAGYEGIHCEHDYCLQKDPCLNGGSCHGTSSGFHCDCQTGYTGDTCDTEVTKCLSNHCLNGGTCYIYLHGFHCRCQPGYEGYTCDADINECYSQPCFNNGTCNDDINLYTCDCLPGWRGVNCEITMAKVDVVNYLVTIAVLAVTILLMIIAFIFYKFCYLKNKEKCRYSKKSVVQYAGPNNTVAISTANAYETQTKAKNQRYEILHPDE